jgi:hypothetical protein
MRTGGGAPAVDKRTVRLAKQSRETTPANGSGHQRMAPPVE